MFPILRKNYVYSYFSELKMCAKLLVIICGEILAYFHLLFVFL